MQLKNLNYLTLILKKNVPKTSIFDKNFDTAALTQAIFKTRNGESRNGMGNRGMERGMEREKPESLKPGTRKAGIFKTRNEKSRNL